ncbi:MAG TPA: 1-deoxy-D-xylulose-5-phosphate reductoisomerase [Anaerolineales bacterium]
MSQDNPIKRIGIFGSTGSIGTQALEVIADHPDKFSAEILTAHSNDELLIRQALQYNPNIVVIGDEKKYQKVKEALASTDTKVFTGEKSLEEVAAMDCYDMMLAAIVGYAGLRPTLKAIDNGKAIGLANKETLVVAGDIVMNRAVENKVPIIPVDSEHSAIFQCLVGETRNRIEKVILTASGGPFIGRKPNYLVNVKREHALQHPNWTMGAKITIDSATLMNKGFEVIEACRLFNLPPSRVQVVVHPQSTIHSMVEFVDGSILAQLSVTDMRLPILYALTWPERVPSELRFPVLDLKHLDFCAPDLEKFPCLRLAYEAAEAGGAKSIALNAADEVAVAAFLDGHIPFEGIPRTIQGVIRETASRQPESIKDVLAMDVEARKCASDLVARHARLTPALARTNAK